VVWRRLTRVTACLLLGFWAVARLKTTGSRKRCRTAEDESIGDGVDGPSLPKLSISTIKPVEAIDASLDHDLFQELIESTNT